LVTGDAEELLAHLDGGLGVAVEPGVVDGDRGVARELLGEREILVRVALPLLAPRQREDAEALVARAQRHCERRRGGDAAEELAVAIVARGRERRGAEELRLAAREGAARQAGAVARRRVAELELGEDVLEVGVGGGDGAWAEPGLDGEIDRAPV